MDEGEILKIERLIVKFGDHLRAINRSSFTVKSYLFRLKMFVGFLREREEEGIAAVTRDTLYHYQMSLCGLRKKDGRPAGLNHQAGFLVAVRAFFRFLAGRGFVLSDPTSVLEFPRIPRGLPHGVMTAREVEKILSRPDVDTALGMRDKAILELLYSTGIRNAELRNLAVADVNIADQEITIRRGKGGADRVLPTGEIAAKCLEHYLRESRPKLVGKQPDPPKALFVSFRGSRLPHTGLGGIVRRHVRAAGVVKPVTPHGFRHTCATHMLKGRASLRHIQELLGHRSLNTTERYTHVEAGDLKREHRRTHPREQAR